MNETSIKDTREILKEISRLKASDIFVVAGRPLSYRLNNQIREYSQERLMPEDTLRIIEDIYAMAANRSLSPLTDQGDDDFSFALPGISRFRVNTYMQRGSAAAVIRIISFTLPSPQELGIPEGIVHLGDLNKGNGPGDRKLPAAASLPLWPVSLTISIKTGRSISSPWKIPWNISTAMKKALSASVRSPRILPATSLLCGLLCARALM